MTFTKFCFSEWGNTLQLLVTSGRFIEEGFEGKNEIIDVDNGTHHCGNSTTSLESGRMVSSGGLISNR